MRRGRPLNTQYTNLAKLLCACIKFLSILRTQPLRLARLEHRSTIINFGMTIVALVGFGLAIAANELCFDWTNRRCGRRQSQLCECSYLFSFLRVDCMGDDVFLSRCLPRSATLRIAPSAFAATRSTGCRCSRSHCSISCWCSTMSRAPACARYVLALKMLSSCAL
jgi:hypothetical protein